MENPLVPAVILWWNDDSKKGMCSDANATVYAFDSRNLSEQLKETGVWETRLFLWN